MKYWKFVKFLKDPEFITSQHIIEKWYKFDSTGTLHVSPTSTTTNKNKILNVDRKNYPMRFLKYLRRGKDFS
jgi:hypothetical protein